MTTDPFVWIFTFCYIYACVLNPINLLFYPLIGILMFIYAKLCFNMPNVKWKIIIGWWPACFFPKVRKWCRK